MSCPRRRRFGRLRVRGGYECLSRGPDRVLCADALVAQVAHHDVQVRREGHLPAVAYPCRDLDDRAACSQSERPCGAGHTGGAGQPSRRRGGLADAVAPVAPVVFVPAGAQPRGEDELSGRSTVSPGVKAAASLPRPAARLASLAALAGQHHEGSCQELVSPVTRPADPRCEAARRGPRWVSAHAPQRSAPDDSRPRPPRRP
jgi:hypothetical protein